MQRTLTLTASVPSVSLIKSRYQIANVNASLGVLTKPDRIPIGEEASWLPFIRNEKESLENGWFCVKQPSSNELKQGLTWDDARAMENQYFSSTAHWAELEGIYQCYLRTSNLVKRLSAVLSDLIAKRYVIDVRFIFQANCLILLLLGFPRSRKNSSVRFFKLTISFRAFRGSLHRIRVPKYPLSYTSLPLMSQSMLRVFQTMPREPPMKRMAPV